MYLSSFHPFAPSTVTSYHIVPFTPHPLEASSPEPLAGYICRAPHNIIGERNIEALSGERVPETLTLPTSFVVATTQTVTPANSTKITYKTWIIPYFTIYVVRHPACYTFLVHPTLLYCLLEVRGWRKCNSICAQNNGMWEYPNRTSASLTTVWTNNTHRMPLIFLGVYYTELSNQNVWHASQVQEE